MLLPDKNFQPILLLIVFKVQLSLVYVLKQEFKLKMPKSTLFSMKNRKNRPSLGALLQDPYVSDGWRLAFQTPPPALVLSRSEFLVTRLIITSAFM